MLVLYFMNCITLPTHLHIAVHSDTIKKTYEGYILKFYLSKNDTEEIKCLSYLQNRWCEPTLK